MTRREFTKTIKAKALRRCCDANGIPRCEGCGAELKAGGTNYDHDTPDGLGGEPTLENCRVLCRTCHDEKTHQHDNPIMQKADAVRKKHFGIRNPSRWPKGRKLQSRNTFDRRVVSR